MPTLIYAGNPSVYTETSFTVIWTLSMTSTANTPIESLRQWVKASGKVQDGAEVVLQALSGDAGFRQYFYIEVDGAVDKDLLAVYAPADKIDSQPFIDLAHYLREEGIHAPQVFAYQPEPGFMLIENYGDQLYLSALNAESVESLYGEALLTLLRMQQSPAQPALLSDYDSNKLQDELNLFPHWFVERLLGHTLNEKEKQLIESVCSLLVDNALEQPQVFVHRDFHSRNLIHRQVGPPGVIDFQDAVWGPITYDLVSLLKDCYIHWPQDRVERWALAYGSMVSSAGLMKPVPARQFIRWFDLMGLQRHLKVLGIFARLFLRDGKSGYLRDLPLVIRYTLSVVDQYSEFAEFSEWFKTKLLPACEQQSWYESYQSAGYAPIVDDNKNSEEKKSP